MEDAHRVTLEPLLCMRSPEKPPPDSIESNLHTFSFDVTMDSSGDLAELQPIQVDRQLGVELHDSAASLPSRFQDSTDDLFASFFGVGHRQSHGSNLRTLDSVFDDTLTRLVLEGLQASDYHGKPNLIVRRGGCGTTANGTAVRWISFQDALTESWLLPDLSVVHAELTSDSPQLFAAARGVERFSFAEPRVLIIGEGSEEFGRIFMPAACRDEAIEHFMRAAAGSDEPSFLYNALEYEMVRRLDGETDTGSENFHDVLAWIRDNLSWTRVGFEGSFSQASAADSVILDLTMTDPTSTFFLDAFGSLYLRCKVSFGDPNAALVQPLSFEWVPT